MRINKLNCTKKKIVCKFVELSVAHASKIDGIIPNTFLNSIKKVYFRHTYTHLSTAVAWREKKGKPFSLVLGLLKSRISEKTIEGLLNKPDFKLFHYKARVQLVSKITTIANRNRC